MAEFYTNKQAAKVLGIGQDYLRHLVMNGEIHVDQMVGGDNIFRKDIVSAYRQARRSPGMTHREIGKVYGKSPRVVKRAFVTKLRIKPSGMRGRATAYDPRTVEKFAKILGWEPVDDQSLTSKSESDQ